MTAATITDTLGINDATKEVVLLTVSDGETYVSRVFSEVIAVQATVNEDFGLISIPLSCDVSTATVTINATGLTDKKVCLTLYGRK